MFSIMLFVFLVFIALLCVLLYILRQQEILSKQLREENAHLRLSIQNLEDHLLGKDQNKEFMQSSIDSLSNLSFDNPKNNENAFDPALELKIDEK